MNERRGQRTAAHYAATVAMVQVEMYGGVWTGWRRWVIALLPYGLALGAAFVIPVGEDERAAAVYGAVVGVVAAHIANCHVAPRLTPSHTEAGGAWEGPFTLRWDAEGIETSCGGIDARVDARAVRGVRERDGVVFLMVDRLDAVTIPRAVFTDEADAAAFVALARGWAARP